MLTNGDVFDDFRLVLLAHAAEEFDRLIAWHDRARHGKIAFGEFLHALLDLRQVVLGETALESEVIVKTVFNDRADGHLCFGEQFLDGLRQQVRRRVANHLDALRALVGDDRQLGVLLDEVRDVHEPAVDAPGQRGAREAGADVRGNLGDRYGFGKFTTATIRQRDDWHVRDLRQWRPLRTAA